MGEELKKHPDYGFRTIWHKLDRPSMFLMDMRPLMWPVIVVADAKLADDIVKASPAMPYGATKSPTVSELHHLLGEESIIMLEGEEWKAVRKSFNPGFQPQYLHSLTSLVVGKANVFVSQMKSAAKKQEVVSLVHYTQALTLDIIGEVTMGHDMHAQSSKDEEQISDPEHLSPIQFPEALCVKLLWEVRVPIFFAALGQRPATMSLQKPYSKLDSRLATIVRTQTESRKPSKRSIMALAIQGQELTPALVKNTVDQLKTFIFAGEDTTAILLAYVFYHLSRTPHALEKLRAEHDAIFGDNTEQLLLTQMSAVMEKMTYTMAVVRETLRLNSPAGGSARMVPPGTGLIVETEAGKACLDGAIIYISHMLIHTREEYWGPDATNFNPDRFLDPSFEIPSGAWRPFERGPRSCIGLELALLEVRVILALTVRQFDFEKVGYDGITEEELYDNDLSLSKLVDAAVMVEC
ncbi:MAG: hypothetical protein M1827_001620 [Pycnora praestabilis]|nr:MAG: hypothetical protein M1827_001620 [Pycnora praestabilis]